MIFLSFIKEFFHIHDETGHPEKKIRPESILDNPNNKIGYILNLFIIFLIIFSIGLIIFESIGDNAFKYSKYLFIFDGFISSIFAIEYFYRLYHSKNKKEFSFKFLNIIDLLAFLPFFLELLFSGMMSLTFLKVLRILRIFRVFKLVKHFKSVGFILKGLKNYRLEYQVSLLVVIIVVLISSIIIYGIEGGVNEGFSSIPQTMWWSIVTIATVGYGDIYPITVWGKIFGSIVILVGPMSIAMISSITVLVFLEVSDNKKKELSHYHLVKCPRCFADDNLDDSNYCRKCGEQIHFERKEKV